MGTFSQSFDMNKLILFSLFALVAVTLAYPEYDRPAPSGEMDSLEGESMESGPMESAEARRGKGKGKGKKGSKESKGSESEESGSVECSSSSEEEESSSEEGTTLAPSAGPMKGKKGGKKGKKGGKCKGKAKASPPAPHLKAPAKKPLCLHCKWNLKNP